MGKKKSTPKAADASAASAESKSLQKTYGTYDQAQEAIGELIDSLDNGQEWYLEAYSHPGEKQVHVHFHVK